MLGVIGFWDNANWLYELSVAEKKYLSFWRISAKAFGVDKLIMIDLDGRNPVCGDTEIEFEIYSTLEEALDAYPNANIVFLENETAVPDGISYENLNDFEHPSEDVIYIFGSDFSGLALQSLDNEYIEKGTVVNVEMPVNASYPWATVMMGIVLYDRWLQWR